MFQNTNSVKVNVSESNEGKVLIELDAGLLPDVVQALTVRANEYAEYATSKSKEKQNYIMQEAASVASSRLKKALCQIDKNCC